MLLLMFRVAESWYAVEAGRVVEVVPRVELRAVPHAPGTLAGLFRYRGRVIPAIDLGLLLGAGACRPRLGTRIIVAAGAGGDRLGLIAEQVNDLRRFADDAAVAPPVRVEGAPYLGPIVQAEEGIIQLIEPERVLAGPLRGAWDEEAGGA